MSARIASFLIVVLLLIGQFGCTVTEDTNPVEPKSRACEVGVSFSCSDTTAQDGMTRIVSWDPAARSLLVLVWSSDTLVTGKSYKHVYNSAWKDSILYWVDTLADSGVVFGGYGVYQYTANGTLRREVLFNPDGTAWDTTVYAPDGPPVPDTGKGCRPGLDSACRIDKDSIAGDDTLRIVREWDPQERRWVSVRYWNDWIDSENAFIHIYDSRMRDSIVMWVSHENPDGSYGVSGWGEYVYAPDGYLAGINNFNEFDSTRYGYVHYNAAGDVIETMEDGYVVVYTDEGKRLKEYFTGSRDSTLYRYAVDGSLEERRDVRNGVTVNKTVYGSFDNGIARIQTYYDSLQNITRIYYRDEIDRPVREEYHSTGAIDSTVIFTYWTEESFTRRSKRVERGDGTLRMLTEYNESGDIVQIRRGDAPPVTCREPLTWHTCNE